MVDRYGPRKVMAWFSILGAIPSGLAGLAHNILHMYSRSHLCSLSGLDLSCKKLMTIIIVAERLMPSWLGSFNPSLNLLDYHPTLLGELLSPLFRECSAVVQESYLAYDLAPTFGIYDYVRARTCHRQQYGKCLFNPKRPDFTQTKAGYYTSIL